MKKIVTVIILLFLVSMVLAFPVHITSWNIKEDVKKLNSLQVSIDYVNSETQTIIVYVPRVSEYDKLLDNGFKAQIVSDAAKGNHNEENTRAYHSLDEYHTLMQNMVTQYPNLCQLVQFGTSVLNRPMYFLKISDNVSVEENEPEFRYSSSIHGDEVVGYENCIRLIQLLTSQYNINARITNIVNNTEIWICPMYNPDGYVAHERYNDNGADLNRNFSMPNGIQHPDGMAWQPETLAMMEFGNNHSINLSANFHGGALVTNYPWDYTYSLCPDNNLFIQMSHSYADHNLPMHNSTEFTNGITNGAAWYIAEGTLQDWVYANNKCMDLTIELSNDKWPGSSQLETFWNDNQESMLTYLEFVQKGIHGIVTNSSGSPLAATIHVSPTGMDIKTDPQVGDYHRVLLPGSYDITVSADGYTSDTETIVVPATGSVIHDFMLTSIVMTSFSGKVTNLQGTLIPNVNVKLTSGSTSYEMISDANGAFLFASIPSGDYTLTASALGFGLLTTSFHLDSTTNSQIIVLPNSIFSEDFENGLSNWTVQSPWGIITQASNHVLTDSPAGNYSNNILLKATLTNPVSLVNTTNAYLVFETKYYLEDGYDFVDVQVSTNGTNWTTLTQLTGIRSEWTTLSLSLANYLGSNLYIRYLIDTDYGSVADGVYIDNIRISGVSGLQTVYGDVDSNWLINSIDYLSVLQYSVGNDPLPNIDPVPWETFRVNAADVDNDNSPTSTDAYYIYDKCRLYNGAFPAQSGTEYTFQNPNLNIQNIDGEIRISAENPANLKALSLQISSQDNLTIPVINWQTTDAQALVASSTDNKTIGLIELQNAQLPSLIAIFPYETTGAMIHISGLVNDVNVNFDLNVTANHDQHTAVPVTALTGNYPNPFNPRTSIRFSVARNATPTKLIVYNAKGQEVKTLLNLNVNSGFHSIDWDGTDINNRKLGNGIYYYKLQTPDKTIIKKMVILK